MATPPPPPPSPPRLPAELLAAFDRHGTTRRLRRGARLFRAGQEVVGLHLVTTGHLRIIREGPRAVVIHHERAGGMLGETALFAGTPYPASAVAAEPTTCRLLPAERVMALLASDPAIATFFLRRLAERLTLVIGRLDSLSRVSVAVRLATHLRGRPGAGDGQPVTLGMTQRELAQELGTVREVVVRELRRLVRRGVLQPAGRGCYRVADPALLATIAGH